MIEHFSPAWWLPGAHLQTVWGRLTRPRVLVSYRREILPTPDGDEILLDHHDIPDSHARTILLHGLEGSSYSVYIQGLVTLLANRGISSTVFNFRSCGKNPSEMRRLLMNHRPRLYHSGETTDLDFVVATTRARHPETTLLAFGASLGGNVLLKWLGEHPNQTAIAAAATLSVPYDLGAGARHLENFLGRMYVGIFLRSLRWKAMDVARRFPEVRDKVDLERAARARTFYEFDDAATAPLHGFIGADDYYTRSSSIHFLAGIQTPTLCLSAEDDPFVPPSVSSRLRTGSYPSVEIRTTRGGGHIGFIAGSLPGRGLYWGETVIADWLLARSRMGNATAGRGATLVSWS